MFVQATMTPDPVTLSADDNLSQAMNIMRKSRIYHLPVVEKERLVGIVVEKDLLSNHPSPATTLSLNEVYSLLETIRMRQIMSRPVITVEGNCPLEEAARIMVENTISCLPVMEGEKLTGIITETDVFKALMEILGGDEEGFRLTIYLPERAGELANVTSLIAQAGGNILAVTTSKVLEDGRRIVTIKESGADSEYMIKLVNDSNIEIIDVRHDTRHQPRLFG